MKAIGLDTSVVLRLLIGKPEQQAQVARQFVEQCLDQEIALRVSDMVIGETYHALIYHYEVPKSEAVSVLRQFLASAYVSATGHALSVLREYRGKGAGLMDRLIRMDLLDECDEVATFDRGFARLPNVVHVGSSID